jgi:DNA-binding transcriptional LysR family regulator
VDFVWLEDFLCLAQSQSFSRSAAQRHVTQSAFSRRIRSLEAWVGFELVDRTTHPVTLTEAGRQFHSTAVEIVHSVEEKLRELRPEKTIARPDVKFAALQTLALSFYPCWLKSVEDGFGPLNTSLQADRFHRSVQTLTEGECDFLLTFFHSSVPVPVDPLRYPHIALGEDRLVAVSGLDKSGRPLFRLPGLPNRPARFLAHPPDSFFGRLTQVVFREHGRRLHLRQVYETAMSDALKAMVAAGHGVAWLPASCVTTGKQYNLCIIDDAAIAPIEVRLYRSANNRRLTVDRLWRFLQQRVHHRVRSVTTGSGRAHVSKQ